MLKSLFIQVYSYYDQSELSIYYWDKIEKAYASKGRYYHNLIHLESLYNELKPVKGSIQDWHVLMMTLFFHDYIYKPLRKDNELRSAKSAKKALQTTSMSPHRINRCYQQIIETRTHGFSNDMDANFFNDADLSILGSSSERYNNYLKEIRKEYRVYPDSLYNSGRKKVVKSFLEMKQIFKTDHFFSKYEEPARQNLERELNEFSINYY